MIFGRRTRLVVGIVCFVSASALAAVRDPIFRTLDIDRGQTQEVQLANGQSVKVKLLDVQEQRDSLRNAIRGATIKVEINGAAATLTSGTYHLPITVGDVQIDCP